ncbi:MAG: hypothetical protein ACNJA3_28300 (plasmid) [Pseudomonas rhizophila]|uniref:hypothetical protein n=1 Tax=Pseudomonas rhizophila TaxID=2045200 RepID=UPI003F6CE14A
MMSTVPTPVQTMVADLLNNFDEGVTIFSVTQNAVKLLPDTHALPPLLTCDGTPHQLARVLDCFARWDGEVRVAVLQDEGLLDVWVI